jgi:hypothetical protein
MDFEKFLELNATDHKGRTLHDMWAFSDSQIEQIHDFIQLVFPLNKPSRSNFNGPYLDNDSATTRIRASQIAKDNLVKSSHWFLSFLDRNHQWQNRHNHNQLRVTRMIESLRLLVSDDQAERCKSTVFRMILDKNLINETTLVFWGKA